MTINKINLIDTEKIKKQRKKLSEIDAKLIRLLANRMKLTLKIGKLKFQNSLGIEQMDFWNESSINRNKIAESCKLRKSFIEELFLLIHKESIKNQKIQLIELENDSK